MLTRKGLLIVVIIYLLGALYLGGCSPKPTSTSTVKYVKINIERIAEPPKVEELRAMLQKPPRIAFKSLERDPFMPPAILKMKGLKKIKVAEEVKSEETKEKKEEEKKVNPQEEKKAEYLKEAISSGVLVIRGVMGNEEEGYSAILQLPDGTTFIIRDNMDIKNYRIVKVLPDRITIINKATNEKIILSMRQTP